MLVTEYGESCFFSFDTMKHWHVLQTSWGWIVVPHVEADINSRDHGGKKPKQVATDCLTIEAQGTWLNRIEFSSHADAVHIID